MKLSYASTVPRQLVHRQSVGEVLLTDYRLRNDAADQIAVQLPASHRILRPTRQRHDPLIVAEAFRQAVMMLSHTKYAVPPHYKFLMEQFGFGILDELEIRSAPMPLILDMTTNHVETRDGTVSRVDIVGVLREGPRVLAHCSAVARCVTPASYSHIRAGRDMYIAHFRAKPPGSVVIPAPCAGRAEEQDVLIAANLPAGELYCAPDPRNYALFDRPLDHIPGMVLFDAAIQAVRYRANDPSLQLARLAATFPIFTEWDDPCDVMVSEAPAHGSFGRSCVTFRQSNRMTAQLEITTATSY
ncbi:ScbA/BarX family gamma-butyrolactone biosynthesis protein [Rhodococcus sp. IEGM 1330]|uniref:ScbA/BarX family gamma-butyrolactone biosynthesis protein n=1 Tax=Rhodococcus sp. IEGM 1330 TaxID=3082225 RepID=UPI0029546849|nr:ScbA/BarX family gamma-butyrolactone biosynthesis protein [Rhodococcus sp. IEGM 1330]MDV8021473.1 ScbA/BarX family gamma-butyrolactone biosynthesis protein [Rhodococcus sp. IEGM 1330]